MYYNISLNMKILIIFLFTFNSWGLFCQSAGTEVLASSGGSSDKNGLSVSWTIGETIINEKSVPDYKLSQGFQQGLRLSVVTESETLPETISINAFPNPVLNSLSINIVHPSPLYHWSVIVYDYKGEVLLQKEKEGNTAEIDFTSLPPGAYLVRAGLQDNYKIFHIIKQ